MVQVKTKWLGVRRAVRLRVAMFAVAIAWSVIATAVLAEGARAGTIGWEVHVVSEPSSFSRTDAVGCQEEHKCDRYQILVRNVGNEPSHVGDKIMLTDTLPLGISTLEPEEESARTGRGLGGGAWNCNEGEGDAEVTCELFEAVPAGQYAPSLQITVGAPTSETIGPLENVVSVDGGGALAPTAMILRTPIDKPLVFEVNEFAFGPEAVGGAEATTAGGHPWQLTTDVGVPSAPGPPIGSASSLTRYIPARNVRSIAVELPTGFVGQPRAAAYCEGAEFRHKMCPAGSNIGVFGLLNTKEPFSFTGDPSSIGCCSALNDLTPEGGYPAEFGLAFDKEVPITLYAGVVRSATGYHARISAPAIPATLETLSSTVSVFGEPGKLNGTGSEEAFLDSPADCEAGYGAPGGPGTVQLELTSWGEPKRIASSEEQIYSEMTGCEDLHFNPSLAFGPSPSGSDPDQEGSSQADEPSAQTVDLGLPQTSGFKEASTPDLRDVSVALAEGFSADPSAATGLVGCKETGPEGINIGSSHIGPGGEDLGDPEATELGEGHAGPGGDGSPYDDGLWHTAPGHCPEASILGTIEVTTPLLSKPLTGHIYLAEPKCGGDGQPVCRESSNPVEDSAENGELFGGYLEIEGSGVIVKVPGKISANPVTGQLTGTFKESPQFPFSDLKVHFKGGARAPVANPQTCGGFSAAWTMSSWAGQKVSGSTPAFDITGCGSSMAFSPSLSVGLSNTTAGAVGSSFVLRFSRQDREQDFSGVSETMPPGLVGTIAGTPLCGEAEANAGTCGSASRIGDVTALAGPGPEPFRVEGGAVYLTGPYGGGPFGLSIVVPTKAGPFNLGNEIIRAAVHINPSTSQVTVVTNRLPQSKFGVPFRVREVITEINKPGFLRDPTSCGVQNLTATLSAAQGATANVSAPLQATGCPGLPFYPGYTESTQGNTSKANGASLTVGVSQNPGESNIAKVDVQLPVNLPSRLTTLQKACTEAQFNANPAGCPEASDIGTAEAQTPLLSAVLRGPAYLVSHGGAAFPDVEFVLQGEGVTIVLDGKTDIKHGITYSNFETVPDAPVKSFTSHFPEGPHSVLAAYGNLCHPTETITTTKHTTKRVHGHVKHITTKVKKTVAKKLISPVTITGQNGAVVHDNVKVTVTNCPKQTPATKPATKHNKKKPKNKKKR